MAERTRAKYILESYDDVITGLINQMDSYAQQSGGYINRMHPDQFDHQGNKKEIEMTEKQQQRTQRSTSRRTSR